MKSSLVSILFAALLGISTSSFQDGGSYPIHVDISVYYESYCPYRLVRSNFDLNFAILPAEFNALQIFPAKDQIMCITITNFTTAEGSSTSNWAPPSRRWENT